MAKSTPLGVYYSKYIIKSMVSTFCMCSRNSTVSNKDLEALRMSWDRFGWLICMA